ncbi:AfsA-related hotdog domain-containing protein [Streptomyces sp. H27-C3]|uniref:AfsA-related hotdog domain-containing protein n=1 Tax=Streptomyces sp. H27-C3 TaxID=3046305 RepID=UPI0024BA91B2|nr:AfsA-related hotdog domain-containing protein [Streptomyces sp. H27-C3]MDJ0465895.1 AfsA-related hotdog domain-containing protein [Streptomyces sp. H27-C3]
MNQSIQSIVLVGDRFVGFAVQENVFTVSQLVEDLQHGAYASEGDPVLIESAQGVSEADVFLIVEELRHLGLDERIQIRLQPSTLSGAGEVHKRLVVNALIADLYQVSDVLYGAGLRVHNDNELLLDHQTGQHVQGMVAVEASRQMFLAVTERFFAAQWPQRKYYFVIEFMNTAFENFLFPLCSSIEYRITEARTQDPSRLSFKADVGIHQAGRRSSLTQLAFTAFDTELIEAKEDRRARQALEHTLRTPAAALAGV